MRFGGPKAPYEFNGERLIDRAVRILSEGGCDPIGVVLGAWVGHVNNAVMLINESWPEGMGSSLRTGLTWVEEETDADYALITLVDLPGLTGEAVERVVDAAPGIAVATFHGRRGHPVRIPREHFRALLDTVSGDEGARTFLAGRMDVTLVDVSDVADGLDLDHAPDV